MVSISEISASKELAIEVQQLLINLKLLSGIADGIIGTQSLTAISELLYITKNTEITNELLKLKSLPQSKLDLSKNDFAAKIAKYMLARNYWIDEQHNNIIYVEGCDPDGSLNADTMNEWNGLRIILGIINGIPLITHCWKATTEPRRYYTMHPLNPGGTFRIEFGQVRAWRVGYQKTHEALVQCADICGYRDKNEDGFRTGEPKVKGSDFGINQYFGYNMEHVNNASAGCLVGQSIQEHQKFIEVIKLDPRYQANANYVFLTTIIPGDKL